MKCGIYEVKDRTQELMNRFLYVWEKSVRATHHFLSDEEVNDIKQYVPQALAAVEHLIAAYNESGEAVAFMGIENNRLEMLFISDDERGKGIGKQLLLYGISKYGVQELTVNEQNPQAIGFYEHMGFKTYKRTELDEEGNAYPLLYMRLGA